MMLDDHSVVGNGSFGKVFTGTYKNKRYAVKRRYILDTVSHGCIHVGEVDALCRFRHPHILRAHTVQRQNPIRDNFRTDKNNSWGQCGGPPYRADLVYVITEAADSDLWKMVTSSLPLERAVRYTYQLLLAIHHIHEHHFIHRDIKPHNILYFKEGDMIKVCDFDMMMPDIEGMDSFKAMTPEYTPPEILIQDMDVTYTNKIDIWGVGLILKFLLTGKPLLSRGDRRGDEMDKYLLALYRKFFPNGTYIPAASTSTDVSREKVDVYTNIEMVDDLLSHMLDCNPETRWDVKMCMSHPLFLSIYSLPKPITPIDHIIDKHYITDDMAKVFDAEFNSISGNKFFGFFLGLDILMRVCKNRSIRVDNRKLAICCYNIGMRYFDKELASTIPIDPNDAKRIEYDIIVEKLQCNIYRDTVYNRIQDYPNRIYRYLLTLSHRFPVKFSNFVSAIRSHLEKKS